MYGGVAHLINQLLGHGRDRDSTAERYMLGNDEFAIRIGFDDGIADIHVVQRFPIDACVAAGRLGAAFVYVPRHDARGDSIPAIVRPAELIDHGRIGQRRIRGTAGDDQPLVTIQAFQNIACYIVRRSPPGVQIRAGPRQHLVPAARPDEILQAALDDGADSLEQPLPAA